MPVDVGAVHKALKADGLDAWLLYDFQGPTPCPTPGGDWAAQVSRARRWFYLIPQTGEPRALVHAIESRNLDHLPGSKTVYAGRDKLSTGLADLLKGLKRIAMEYSPNCAIPYVSRVDGGTIELIRGFGVEVVSSGDLIQQFESHWNTAAIATHRAASEKLYRIKDQPLTRSRVGCATRLDDGV